MVAAQVRVGNPDKAGKLDREAIVLRKLAVRDSSRRNRVSPANKVNLGKAVKVDSKVSAVNLRRKNALSANNE